MLSHTAYYLTENVIFETNPFKCNEFVRNNDQMIYHYYYSYSSFRSIQSLIQPDVINKVYSKLDLVFLGNNTDIYLRLARAIEDIIMKNKCVYIFSEEQEVDKLCILAIYLQSRFKSSENLYKDIFEVFKITDPKRIDSIRKFVLIYIIYA